MIMRSKEKNSAFLTVMVLLNLINHEYSVTEFSIIGILGLWSLQCAFFGELRTKRHAFTGIILSCVMVYSIMNDSFDNEKVKHSNSGFLTEQKVRIKIVKPFFINNQNGNFHKVRILESRMLIDKKFDNYSLMKIERYKKIRRNEVYDIVGVIKNNSEVKNRYPLIIDSISRIRKIEKRKNRKDQIVEIIESSNSSEQCRAFILALLLGDKERLSQKQLDIFRGSGTMHLFAVSGLHIGCVYSTIYILFGLLIKNKKIQVSMPLFILWLYIDIIGYSVSSVRSFLMISLWCVAKVCDKRTEKLNIFILVCVLSITVDSKLLYSLGFQLSFTVVLTILWLFSLRKYNEGQSKIKLYTENLVLVGYASYWGSFLLILDNFNMITPYSLLINIILVPFIGILFFTLVLYIVFLFFIGNNYTCSIINFIYRSIHGYLDFSSNQYYSVIKCDVEINNCVHLFFFFGVLFFYHKSKTLLFRLLFLPLFCCLMLFISFLINFMN